MAIVGSDLELALGLAGVARDVALGLIGRDLGARLKEDGTPVTRVDLAVERALREELAMARPDESVFGEELGGGGTRARRWILDPIDGTHNLVDGDEQWGTHIALQEPSGEITVGVITRPALGLMWWAQRGGGAFRAPMDDLAAAASLRVSAVDDLAASRCALWERADTPRAQRLARQAHIVPPSLGNLLELLEGKLEAVVDVLGKPWDHAPVFVLTREAGGVAVDHLGGERIDVGEVRYSNAAIAARLRRVLDDEPRRA